MMKINIDELKPQYLMTKDDFANENRTLRCYIDQLERELEKAQETIKYQAAIIAELQNEDDDTSQNYHDLNTDDDWMKPVPSITAQYMKYRQIFGEKPSSLEIKLNLDAINELNRIKEQ